jgi:hypothetical protein
MTGSSTNPTFTAVLETLRPELQGSASIKPDYVLLSHPYITEIVGSSEQAVLLNRYYPIVDERVERAREEQGPGAYVFAHSRPYRFSALLEAEDWWSGVRRGELIRDTWLDSENIWQHYEEWCELLSGTDRRDFMSAKDAVAFAKLSGKFQVFRGCVPWGNTCKQGLSWTTEPSVASMFAKRLGCHGKGEVLARCVRKTEVYAMVVERNEHEIIILP